jgi:hypothetical protein
MISRNLMASTSYKVIVVNHVHNLSHVTIVTRHLADLVLLHHFAGVPMHGIVTAPQVIQHGIPARKLNNVEDILH